MSKQEFILSFNNEEKRRYEEFLFEYRNYSIINEYKFIYQRDGISLDVEYFKDLVFLSKKATRSSLSCSYLPLLHSEDIEANNNIVQVHMHKPIRSYIINNYIKTNAYTNMFETAFLAYPTFKHYLDSFQNFMVYPLHNDLLSQFQNVNMRLIHDDRLTVLDMYWYSHDFYLDIYQYLQMKNNNDYLLNITEHVPLIHYMHQKHLNIIDNLFLHRDNFLFITDTVMFSQYTKHLFINDHIYLRHIDKIVSIYDDIYMKNAGTKHIILFENILAEPTYYRSIYLFDSTFTLPNNLHMNYFEVILTDPTFNKYLNVFQNSFMFKDIYHLYVFQYDIAYKIFTSPLYRFAWDNFALFSKQLMMDHTIDNANKDMQTRLNIFNPYDSFNKDNLRLYMSDMDNIGYINKMLATYIGTDFVLNYNKRLVPYPQDTYSYKNVSSKLMTYDIVLAEKYNYILSWYNDQSFFVKHNQSLFIDNVQRFALTYNNHLRYIQDISFAFKGVHNFKPFHKYDSLAIQYSKAINFDRNIISSQHIYRGFSINKFNAFGILNSKSINVFTNATLYQTSIGIRLYNGLSIATKFNKQLERLLNLPFITKNMQYIYSNVYDTFTIKANNNIHITQNHLRLVQALKKIIPEQPYAILDKFNYFIQSLLYNDDLLKKYNQNMFLDNNMYSMFKEYQDTDLSMDYVSDLIKEYHILNNQQAIVSINKVNKPMFTVEIINDILKQSQHISLNVYTLFNKFNKSLLLHDDVLCDKLMSNVNFVSLLNTMVIKKRILLRFFNNDIFINQDPHSILMHFDFNTFRLQNEIVQNIDVVVYRNTQSILNTQHVTLNKYLEMYQNEDYYIARSIHIMNTFTQEWINIMKYAFIRQDINTFRTMRDAYLDDKDIPFVVPKELTHYDQVYVDIKKHGQLYDTLNVLRVNNFPAAFYDQYFVSKNIIFDKLPNLQELQKLSKDIIINTDSTMDWAWVYQEEEGFDDPFKIDELLLPENDTRYEDFEDILFNRKTLTPRAPIQIIDDYTFIAKFPNHYPIKDDNGENAYKNIALEYLDVRTSIMRQVFLGYYKLWQDHIFEFAQMTIPQSAKKMLDYLYTWILMSFAEEDIPEALRSFRLVRWYLERGIIECSEYYITYEPDDLTSGMLDTTVLAIPNDLMPPDESIPQNNTMYIDTTRHIIANNPNKLGQEAHITFYIDNRKDTTISFSLHTFTPVYIILNEGTDHEEIIDTISLPTTGKMIYNIPYTGETNSFTIKKFGADNHDNDFFIGNIIIPQMGSTGNLNIEFNPKVQGNKVLSNVSQKVISYMNLYHDNEELMKNLVKGNVHINEAYEHLLEYWELHHQDKDKGKRLTIKRT